MSARPASSQTRRALRSVSASGRLPATATRPRTSNSSAAANASRIATASSRPGSVSMMIRRRISRLPAQHQQLFDLGDCLGWVEVLRAGAGAVHDRMAAVEAERVFELVEALAGLLV